jgi:hypothetical protein
MIDDLRDPTAQKIYALFPDHTYLVFADTWEDGMPERICSGSIQAGRLLPKRGFGRVWCENPVVQAQLPGAVAEEALLQVLIQPFERGVMWGNTPEDVIILLADGEWR